MQGHWLYSGRSDITYQGEEVGGQIPPDLLGEVHVPPPERKTPDNTRVVPSPPQSPAEYPAPEGAVQAESGLSL